MAGRSDDLLDKLGDLQHEFERELRQAHKRLKQSIPAYLRESHPLNILSAPIVYSVIVPIVVLDLWVSLYQWACFPLFRIAKVRRRDFIVIDRHKLAYLNGIEKFNCVYCGYANGVFAYVREITGRTETYWCPIKHARKPHDTHDHYDDFVAYGDASGYKRRLPVLRRGLKR